MGHKILWNTKRFVDERTNKDFARDGYWFSLWSSIIVGLSVVLISFVLAKKGLYSGLTVGKSAAIFLVSFSIYYLVNIISGYITQDVVGMLKKDITFSKALAAVSYALFLLSVGFGVMTIFAIFPGLNILTPIIGIICIARSYGIYIRFLHEYAKLENIEAYIVSIILLSAIAIGLSVGINLIGGLSNAFSFAGF